MKITLKEFTIRELTENYEDQSKTGGGVFGYNMKLNIRPSFQRNFVYEGDQRDAVVSTVMLGRPLNVMYWSVRDDGGYEVIDGQQRTISIAQYVTRKFSYNKLYFHNLQPEQKNKILDYKVMVYICEGTDGEKLDWFKTINIGGEKLSDQELRNAIYSGAWVSDAKEYFSKSENVAYKIGSNYFSGGANRQEYMERAIDWASGGDIEEYMAEHQHKESAIDLYNFYKGVIDWIKTTFPVLRSEMKAVKWIDLYREYKDASLDPDDLENRISTLMRDDEITKKSGIYAYILTGKEKYLNNKTFTPNQRREAYEDEECQGSCALCDKTGLRLNQMEADHITPWHLGGKTEAKNCQMLCIDCNRTKGGK